MRIAQSSYEKPDLKERSSFKFDDEVEEDKNDRR
jgi:hypothetical protein